MNTAGRSLPERITALYLDLDHRLASTQTASPDDTAVAITTAVVSLIPAVQHASVAERRVTVDGHRNKAFRMITATDDLAERNDRLQQSLSDGPVIDVLMHGAACRTGDVAHDPRWGEFGPRADAVSILSLPLATGAERAIEPGRTSALTLYATQPDAFDDTTQVLATVLAAHTVNTLVAATARTKTANLERALTSSREIGMAMGVLMANHKITRDDAFTRLRVASQHTNRRLADIAREVTETGMLEAAPAQVVALALRSPDHTPTTGKDG